MLNVCFQKAVLLFRSRVVCGVDCVGVFGIVVVVAPFCLEAVSKE